MSTFPRSPKLVKGALVSLKIPSKQVLSTISFQYNPETVTRTLQIQATQSEGGARSEALRLKGAPAETYKLDVEIDATDALDAGNQIAVNMGIHNRLAALETLVYPDSQQVSKNMVEAGLGMLEVVPQEAPLTLLMWGKQRALPVRVTELSVTEEAYDINLNPIRAKVSLGLRVLTYDDLPWLHPGSSLFFTHHQKKERLAKLL
jgi:hypothetical protein